MSSNLKTSTKVGAGFGVMLAILAALGVVGIFGLLWSATGVFSATANAVNCAWEIQYKHPFYIKKPKEIIMVLGTGFSSPVTVIYLVGLMVALLALILG